MLLCLHTDDRRRPFSNPLSMVYDFAIDSRRAHYRYLFLILCSHSRSRDFDVIRGILCGTTATARTMIRQNRTARELLRCKRLLNSWKWNFIRARYPCLPFPPCHGYARFVRIGISRSFACQARSIVYHCRRPEPAAASTAAPYPLKVFLTILRTLGVCFTTSYYYRNKIEFIIIIKTQYY